MPPGGEPGAVLDTSRTHTGPSIEGALHRSAGALTDRHALA